MRSAAVQFAVDTDDESGRFYPMIRLLFRAWLLGVSAGRWALGKTRPPAHTQPNDRRMEFFAEPDKTLTDRFRNLRSFSSYESARCKP